MNKNIFGVIGTPNLLVITWGNGIVMGKPLSFPNPETIKKEEIPEPGHLFEKISVVSPDGYEEFFFRPNETDDNGAGWDFRNGK